MKLQYQANICGSDQRKVKIPRRGRYLSGRLRVRYLKTEQRDRVITETCPILIQICSTQEALPQKLPPHIWKCVEQKQLTRFCLFLVQSRICGVGSGRNDHEVTITWPGYLTRNVRLTWSGNRPGAPTGNKKSELWRALDVRSVSRTRVEGSFIARSFNPKLHS